MNIIDYVNNFASKWKVVVIAATLGVLLGLAYAATFASDNDPYPSKASAECLVVFTEFDTAEIDSSRITTMGGWVSTLTDNDDVLLSISEDETVISLAKKAGENPLYFANSRITFKYYVNASKLEVIVLGESEQEAEELCNVAVNSFQKMANRYFEEDFGHIEAKVINERVGSNPSSGVTLQQVAAFCAAGAIAGVCVAALLVFLGDFVTYSSLVNRYVLPVYGPYRRKGGELKAVKASILSDGAYEGFPENVVLVPSGKVRISLDRLKERIESMSSKSINAKWSSEIDEVASLLKAGSAIAMVVIKGHTTHAQVLKTLRRLDAYGLEPSAFCLIEGKRWG